MAAARAIPFYEGETKERQKVGQKFGGETAGRGKKKASAAKWRTI